MERKQSVILLVENDYADVFMFRRALACVGFSGMVKVVSDVTEAVSYLTLSADHTDPEYNPRPNLIVCDLKLCASTGAELLRWIRTQAEFRDIPVIMFSGSSQPPDRALSRELGARGFFLKSGDINEMSLCARALLALIENADTPLVENVEMMQRNG